MAVPPRKITVVGAGYVGMTVAHRVLQLELAGEVVLIDVLGDRAKGIALDLAQAGAVEGYSGRVVGGSDASLAEGSDVVVMTAGRPRKPGMSRSDLLEVNGRIVVDVAKWIGPGSPDAVVIVVTNPLDSMAALLRRKLAWPARRVIGMAGALDAARFASFVADATGTSVVDVDAMVLGAHGDSMVPLTAATTVAGVPVKQLLPANDVAALAARTRNGGAEIVKLLGSGSAFFAPAAGAARMAAAILRDERRLIPCTVELQGEYGIEGLPIGVPCILGAGGVLRILELPLDTDARIGLNKCAGEVQRDIDSLRALGLL